MSLRLLSHSATNARGPRTGVVRVDPVPVAPGESVPNAVQPLALDQMRDRMALPMRPESTKARSKQRTFAPGMRYACAISVGALLALSCRNQRASQNREWHATAATSAIPATRPAEELLLAGQFERVSKATSGRAEIWCRGTRYELRLTDVTVATDAAVRVYLVAHERASSTFLVDSAALKYDMAELERGVSQQVIELPSEPDPRLRSVVLFHPSFGINLGFAPLRPITASK